MKKSMIAGGITGAGLCMCAIAGAQKPILSTLDCVLICGVALISLGVAMIKRQME